LRRALFEHRPQFVQLFLQRINALKDLLIGELLGKG
jgi:hypothetical protein